ncbi:hypothetical protein BOX15_Mlig026577g1 [Macrostomum lignano]|uniref:Uncharacterized protein n=1 Tax=Macrostomum lignano TaxID=282301 RepID=A0A267H685_9PLAT|nr:hypothetical protein BOX15_Mlig026577g1 [Macrostomum lignano]
MKAAVLYIVVECTVENDELPEVIVGEGKDAYQFTLKKKDKSIFSGTCTTTNHQTLTIIRNSKKFSRFDLELPLDWKGHCSSIVLIHAKRENEKTKPIKGWHELKVLPVQAIVTVELELCLRNSEASQNVYVFGNCKELDFSYNSLMVPIGEGKVSKNVNLTMVKLDDGSLQNFSTADCLSVAFQVGDNRQSIRFPAKKLEQVNLVGDCHPLQSFILELDWTTKKFSVYRRRDIDLKFFVQETKFQVDEISVCSDVLGSIKLIPQSHVSRTTSWMRQTTQVTTRFNHSEKDTQSPVTLSLDCSYKGESRKKVEIKLAEDSIAGADRFLIVCDADLGEVTILPALRVPLHFLLQVEDFVAEAAFVFILENQHKIELQLDPEINNCFVGVAEIELCFYGNRAICFDSEDINDQSLYKCQVIKNYYQKTEIEVSLVLTASFRPTFPSSSLVPTFVIMHELRSNMPHPLSLSIDRELLFHLNSASTELFVKFCNAPKLQLKHQIRTGGPLVVLFSQEDQRFLMENQILQVGVGSPSTCHSLSVPKILQHKKFLVCQNESLKMLAAGDIKCQFALTGYRPEFGQKLYIAGTCPELGNGAPQKQNKLKFEQGSVESVELTKQILACKRPSGDGMISWGSTDQDLTKFWVVRESPSGRLELLLSVLRPGRNEICWDEKSLLQPLKIKMKFVISVSNESNDADQTPLAIKVGAHGKMLQLRGKSNLYMTELFDAVLFANDEKFKIFLINQKISLPLNLGSLKGSQSRAAEAVLVSAVYGGANDPRFVAVAQYFGVVNFEFRVTDSPIQTPQRLFLRSANCKELRNVELQSNNGVFTASVKIEMCQISGNLLAWNPFANRSLVVSFYLEIVDEAGNRELREQKYWNLEVTNASKSGKELTFIVAKKWNQEPVVFRPFCAEIKLSVDCDVTSETPVCITELRIKANSTQQMLDRITTSENNGRIIEHWENNFSIDEPLTCLEISGEYSRGNDENILISLRRDISFNYALNAPKYRIHAILSENLLQVELQVAPMVTVILHIACSSSEPCEAIKFQFQHTGYKPLSPCYKAKLENAKPVFVEEKQIEMYRFNGQLLLENNKPLRLKFQRKQNKQVSDEVGFRDLDLKCDAAAGECHFWYNAQFNAGGDLDSLVRQVQINMESRLSDSKGQLLTNITERRKENKREKRREPETKREINIPMCYIRDELLLPGKVRLMVIDGAHVWKDIRLFSNQLEGKLYFNVELLPSAMHRVFPSMTMVQLPRDSVLHVFQSALHFGLPDLPDEEKSYEKVRDSLAKHLVPVVKENGDYVKEDPANQPHKFHDIWGEDPGSDTEDNPDTQPEPRSPLTYARLKHRRNRHSARNFAFEAQSRLNVVYHNREAKVFKHLSDAAQNCDSCRTAVHARYEYHGRELCEFNQPTTHDQYIEVLTQIARKLTSHECECQIDSQFLIRHSAAIVRGRLEAFLVGKGCREMLSKENYHDWKRHAEAASSWFVLLVAVWHRCEGLISGNTVNFEDAIREQPLQIPMFYRWRSGREQ